ncbi:MOSC domain-containing protein [Microcoleus sp. FACHB-1515]|uniref:MOSC domain-containing protein n=1 Tax=Cyanophyceae TaxID=3028117 RepID=UPI001685CD40|nr:MOSC domain-containing protein [Microcoleus sp. FACHB-1515]MBD2090766.1 MOSC domain-containing protein [Microcoleus sp. FACHB-1515]
MTLTLTQLNIYPVKSAAGIALRSAQAQLRGLEFDRRWMITDLRGKFMTQRQFPRMALIQTQIEAGKLHLSAAGMESIAVVPTENSPVKVEVWGDRCSAIPADDVVNGWLSKFLDRPCQLVYMPDDAVRPVDRNYAVDERDRVSFADGFPYLLISEASLADLNSRLATPLPMNRFRPNFVVSGCEPFAEDGWRKIRIGSIGFHLVKLCSRCVITTVDQATGDRGQEPLATLGSYRLRKGKILFGQNLVPDSEGTIALGDAIEVLE